MPLVVYAALPFSKAEVTLALESGIDGLVVPQEHKAGAQRLARVPVFGEQDFSSFFLKHKQDETSAALELAKKKPVLLRYGWEVIPVENLLAEVDNHMRAGDFSGAPAGQDASGFKGLAVEAGSLKEACLAAGILERGVDMVVVLPQALNELEQIVAALKYAPPKLKLVPAEILEITSAGVGHRVCVDTLSLLKHGQGMLVGNSAAFTFLLYAETEHNEYAAARPFRINAGSVHSYAMLPGDKTCYLTELNPGQEILVVSHNGECKVATTGRIKTERRPMLLLRAKTRNGEEGTVFLQNAETIHLAAPGGQPVSLVDIAPGMEVLCNIDEAGRHFGLRIAEDIKEY